MAEAVWVDSARSEDWNDGEFEEVAGAAVERVGGVEVREVVWGGGAVRARWWGARGGVQPALLLHGWQDNAASFDELAPRLLEGGAGGEAQALLALDLPGHGLSAHHAPHQPYFVFWDGVRLVRRLVHAHGWRAPLTLVGHSLGGALAFTYAAAFPAETARIVCLDIASPAVRPPDALAPHLGAHLDRLLRYERERAAPPAYERAELERTLLAGHGGALSPHALRTLLTRGARPLDPATPHLYCFTRDPRLKWGVGGSVSLDLALSLARQISCPVLNVRCLGAPGDGEGGASEGGVRWRGEGARYYDAVLDELRARGVLHAHTLHDAHHHAHMERAHAAALAPALRAFLHHAPDTLLAHAD